jgi:hypothetical protein
MKSDLESEYPGAFWLLHHNPVGRLIPIGWPLDG